MVTIYNPSDKMFEVAAPNGSVYTFLDNTCKDVEESVARVALVQHPVLQIISGKLTMEDKEEASEDTELERLEKEIESEESSENVVLQPQPDGSMQMMRAEDVKILGVDTAGMEYHCSHPGCRNTYTNVVIFKQHMKAHDQKDRKTVAAKVVEIRNKKGAKKPVTKEYENANAKEHEESHAGSKESSKEGSEESSSS